MPYPTPPAGPPQPWTPADCATGRQQLIDRYDQAENDLAQALRWLQNLRLSVCNDAETMPTTPGVSAECLDALRRLCERLGSLEALLAQQGYDTEAQIVAAIAAIDCNSPNWRAAWLAALGLVVSLNNLRGDVARACKAGKHEYELIKRGPCGQWYLHPEDQLPPGGAPVWTPYYDYLDGSFVTLKRYFPPPGGGGGPPGPQRAPAPAASPCGCGSP